MLDSPLYHQLPTLPPPTDVQQIFLDACEEEQLYGGAKRGGKTFAGSLKVFLLSYFHPGNRGMIARKNLTDLKDSTLVTLLTVIPPEYILDHNRSDRLITIRTIDPKVPSYIIYRGLGEPGEVEKAKGVDLGWLWVDEPSEIDEGHYTMLKSQLNWQLPRSTVFPNGGRPPYMAMLTSNPEPGWVKERFIVNGVPEGAVFIPALPRDNPHLPPGWENKLRSSNLDPMWVKKYLDGSWDAGTGQVFTELDPRVHDLDLYTKGKPYDIRGHKAVGSLDHASTGWTAFLPVVINSSEDYLCTEEYYHKNRLISEHAADIISLKVRMEKALGQPFDYLLADPSTEAKTLQGRDEMFSVADAYYREGLPLQMAFRASILVGINLIKELLRVDPLHRNPFTGELGSPRLFISRKGCPNLWKEMIELRKEIQPAGGVKFVGRDHLIDDLRYIAMSRPTPAEVKEDNVAKLPPQDAFVVRAHDNFVKRFGRKHANNGSYF